MVPWCNVNSTRAFEAFSLGEYPSGTAIFSKEIAVYVQPVFSEAIEKYRSLLGIRIGDITFGSDPKEEGATPSSPSTL